jgi:hypothetical protein
MFSSARWTVLAVLLSLFVPAKSHAGVFISVAVAPPALLTYDQPPCPEPGWIWTPGYWAYDYNSGGYYWVPGTWVPAPYAGALWTPGYWGWGEGVYVWHPGYWGQHVGYYGGVNYGFGYFGVGFMGGMWHGNVFAYNTAVWHVNRTVVHEVYEDRRDIDRYTIRNDHRVAYSGGPGGVRYEPNRDERNYMREEHMQPTSYQQQHMDAADRDRSAYFNNNHGRPATVAAERPMGSRGPDMRQNGNNGGPMNGYQNNRGDDRNGGNNAPFGNNRGQMPNNQRQDSAPQYQPQMNQQGPSSNMRMRQPERQIPEQISPPAQQQRQMPVQQMRQQPEMQRPMPQPQMERQQPQQRAPESRPAPQEQHGNGGGNGNGNGNGHGHDKK